jgi:hypothetical protein
VAKASEAGRKSDRKGNPVIYLALALPGLLVVTALSKPLATRYVRSMGEPKAVEAPLHPEGQTINPATLIKPQNMKYVG